MEGKYIWKGRQSVETLFLREHEVFIYVNSTVHGVFNKSEFEIKYSLILSSDWRTKEVKVESSLFDKGTINLKSDLNGGWFNEANERIPELNGCIDVDISVTPFTNTLPIRRLSDDLQKEQKIEVLFIDPLLGKYKKVSQQYLRLSSGLYHYEGASGNYRTKIAVDENGLVVTYPDLFKRLSEMNENKKQVGLIKIN